MKEKILVCGDIHGHWDLLNKLIKTQNPDIILQCGDFGWWPKFHKTTKITGLVFDQYGIKNPKTKIYFAPGNHEDWDSLDFFGYTIGEIMPNIFYCPFGSILELPDKRKVMFCGGADSIDKNVRVPGHTWWQQEVVTYKDMMMLPQNENVDIIISHTVPFRFLKNIPYYYFKSNDPSYKYLDQVFDMYKPKWWYNGHFHCFMQQTIDDCKWTLLSSAERYLNWWIKLDE